jgi:NDP-sugar pyrophosphorylase family protein
MPAIMRPNCGKLTLPKNLEAPPSLNGFIRLSSNFLSDTYSSTTLIHELDNLLAVSGNSQPLQGAIQISGNLILGAEVLLLPGTVIQGPCIIGDRSVIGPNAFLRPGTVIGSNAKVGFGVEIKQSVLFDESHVNHHSYVGHSLVGEKVNIGAGVILAARRLDDRFVRLATPHCQIVTAQKKLGSVVEREALLGVGLYLMPGTWIGRGSRLKPIQYLSGFISLEPAEEE